MDMSKDIFADCTYGQLALQKFAPVQQTFRLYSAGWLEAKPKDWNTMKVTGADFRIAKAGPNKGKMSIMVKGSARSVFISRAEMQAAETNTNSIHSH